LNTQRVPEEAYHPGDDGANPVIPVEPGTVSEIMFSVNL
jgi:hypothetical protein